MILTTVQRMERLRSSDRKSTRLNSSHLGISYAVFCLKKKKKKNKHKNQNRGTKKKGSRKTQNNARDISVRSQNPRSRNQLQDTVITTPRRPHIPLARY